MSSAPREFAGRLASHDFRRSGDETSAVGIRPPSSSCIVAVRQTSLPTLVSGSAEPSMRGPPGKCTAAYFIAVGRMDDEAVGRQQRRRGRPRGGLEDPPARRHGRRRLRCRRIHMKIKNITYAGETAPRGDGAPSRDRTSPPQHTGTNTCRPITRTQRPSRVPGKHWTLLLPAHCCSRSRPDQVA